MGLSLSEHQKTFRRLATTHIKESGDRIKVLAVAGPNWSWKTTLIRALLKRFPDEFTEVVQVVTRPSRADDRARRFVAEKDFRKEKIIVGWVAGLYNYWYALCDLLAALRQNKILIFEGISRWEKLKNILGSQKVKWVIVGVLPPGKEIKEMIIELRKRLMSRTTFSTSDVEKKLSDAEHRIIPEVLKKAQIIVRSSNYETKNDVDNITKNCIGLLQEKW